MRGHRYSARKHLGSFRLAVSKRLRITPNWPARAPREWGSLFDSFLATGL